MAIKFFNLHTHYSAKNAEETAIISYSIAEKNKINSHKELFSIGLHPWFINELTLKQDLAEIADLARKKNCAAIGECGLDRLRGPELTIQAKVFSQQVEIANNLSKPLVIHCVRSFPELLVIKKGFKDTTPWIIHGFQGNQETVRQLLKHDIYLSLGKEKQTGKMAKILSLIPVNRLFIETDEEQIPIAEIYSKVAYLKKISLSELKETIFSNAESLHLIH